MRHDIPTPPEAPQPKHRRDNKSQPSILTNKNNNFDYSYLSKYNLIKYSQFDS